MFGDSVSGKMIQRKRIKIEIGNVIKKYFIGELIPERLSKGFYIQLL